MQWEQVKVLRQDTVLHSGKRENNAIFTMLVPGQQCLEYGMTHTQIGAKHEKIRHAI